MKYLFDSILNSPVIWCQNRILFLFLRFFLNSLKLQRRFKSFWGIISKFVAAYI